MPRYDLSAVRTRVLAALTDLYLEKGTDHSAKDIAERAELPQGVVRKALLELYGTEVRSVQEYRATHSKSFPGMEHGSVKVWVYGPSRRYLAALLKQADAAAGEYGILPLANHLERV